ncbi:MAG TPA: triose-phosphate isomerase [Alphaproteobacteria bacterium]|nr:triose-phosphate isomerase [Alphaproteobacteria bacterium]
MKKLIAGNWKMNGTLESARALAVGVAEALAADRELLSRCDFVVCPPFLHLATVRAIVDGTASGVALGAQDCAATPDGAHTGDVSAAMLRDFGCDYVIIGHSERRQNHGETNQTVAAKARLAHEKGLTVILCVGEREDERAAGGELDVVENQLVQSLPPTATPENTVIAYEPVWAIGTGKTATPDDVRAMHRFIRRKLGECLAQAERVRILYGGSVKPDNAAELFRVENVDGALIGGASLKVDQYMAIARGA